ncbi:propanediol dehydratase reactivase beta subunit PduH [Brooklawnia cerclae]|uniref:Dehydratase medium subunit n=1 Tax=Brooklawnia cerclae TaxID=349934 RepID=A0ABX0SG72_9ACTN|nr:glycerol dehydratase reactivase beta/small subunit family protein [Brooklawnia cerclae]NIH55687.1 hypothetical protein [Brooklawnia cerclae]
MSEQRPTVCVRVHDAVSDAQIAEVLHGLEEEGVPAEVSRHTELSPLTLAHDASRQSRLGVGIGASLDYLVITTEKLPVEQPYLALTLNRSADSDRAAGANAARLVKRMPLLDLAN